MVLLLLDSKILADNNQPVERTTGQLLIERGRQDDEFANTKRIFEDGKFDSNVFSNKISCSFSS